MFVPLWFMCEFFLVRVFSGNTTALISWVQETLRAITTFEPLDCIKCVGLLYFLIGPIIQWFRFNIPYAVTEYNPYLFVELNSVSVVVSHLCFQ